MKFRLRDRACAVSYMDESKHAGSKQSPCSFCSTLYINWRAMYELWESIYESWGFALSSAKALFNVFIHWFVMYRMMSCCKQETASMSVWKRVAQTDRMTEWSMAKSSKIANGSIHICACVFCGVFILGHTERGLMYTVDT